MTAMSDKWIAHQCNKPTHKVAVLHSKIKSLTRLIAPPYNVHEQRLIDNWCENSKRDIYSHINYAQPVSEEDVADWKPMIAPFCATSEKYSGDARIISRGLSSYGYDVTLSGNELKLFTNLNSVEIDPRNMDHRCFVDPVVCTDPKDGCRYVLLPPNSYLLGFTEEHFNIPRDIMVICVGKSTYARAGIAVNVTPIEPGFAGQVVIEIANQTTLPARIYVDQGIAQFVFFQGNEDCAVSYADRGGKYMNQTGLTHAKV